MKTFKLGMIGFGYWGRILYRYLSKDSRFEVLRIGTRYPARIKGDFPEKLKLGNSGEVLSDPEIDAVIVATPLGHHYPYIIEALSMGKHVFSEKPLAVTGAMCEKIKQKAMNMGLKVFTDYILTFSPAVRRMLELANEGAIGKIRGFSFHVRQLGHFSNDVYWDLGSHVLGILYMLKPLDAFSFHRQDIYVRDGIVESGMLSVSDNAPDGLRGAIVLSFNHPVKERNMTLYGDSGTLVYDMMSQPPLIQTTYRVDRSKSRDPLDRKVTTYDFDEFNTVSEVINGFYDTLTGKNVSNIDLALQVSRVLEVTAKKP